MSWECVATLPQARQDGEFGALALNNMIEIYINPDNGEIFSETAEAKGNNSEMLAAAEKVWNFAF